MRFLAEDMVFFDVDMMIIVGGVGRNVASLAIFLCHDVSREYKKIPLKSCDSTPVTKGRDKFASSGHQRTGVDH